MPISPITVNRLCCVLATLLTPLLAIIKHAWSGTNLHTQWNPATPGKQYKIFIETVTAGIQALEQRGDTPVIRGMLWQQGEADCKNQETAEAYGKNLVELIRAIRRDVQAPEDVVHFGTTGTLQLGHRFADAIGAAIERRSAP